MTWELFGEASRDLAQTVADDYEPDMILSIARGGLLIGGALGYALSVKNVYTMNVEFYTGVDERLEVPRILPPAPDFVDVSDARILIADDVADTGHTLRSVQQFCEGKVAEVRTAVLYEKSHSVVQCDYVWKRTDLWINFPWSDKDPVAKRTWAVNVERPRRLTRGRRANLQDTSAQLTMFQIATDERRTSDLVLPAVVGVLPCVDRQSGTAPASCCWR